MKIKHNVHGWINNETPSEGEQYLVAHGGKLVDGSLTGYGGHTAIYSIEDPAALKAESERAWRNSEILRTDNLVVLPDYPEDLIAYRAALRDYPQQVDFPNGVRPAE